ncbi:MAG TPA: hypothetical protein VK901_05365 [Nitrospiraceae bacterium]|nr:hypothetical protein [Nitrospiraceae bacterium]
MLRQLITVLGIAITLSASGCSDQTTEATSESTAEGLWVGTINTNRTLTAAVLDDGTYYFFYSVAANPNQVAGVIQGTGTSNNGRFTSSNTKDFGIGVAVRDATISADYAARQFLNGTIPYSGAGVATFTSSYNPAYDTTPTVASLAGVYNGQLGSSGGVQTASMVVQPDGTFTGTDPNGCAFTGKATARTRGNIFDQSLTFGGAPCSFAGNTLQGIMYFNIPTRRLYTAAPNSLRTDAVIFFGPKTL